MNKIQLPGIHCVIFGSDAEYIKIAETTAAECKKFTRSAKIHLFDPTLIPKSIVQFAAENKRGYGYWLWKSWIVKHTLAKLKHDDILVYIDGRCNIGDNFDIHIRKFIENRKLDMVVWSIDNCPERNWTKGDIFEELEVDYWSFASVTNQLAATFFVMRKSTNISRFVDDWFEFCSSKTDKITDAESYYKNHKNFIENRHDQSAFSLILKSRYISRNLINTKIITSADLATEDFIIPHGKFAPHEAKYLWLVKFIPKFLRPICGRLLNLVHWKF